MLYQAAVIVEPLAAQSARYLRMPPRQPEYRRGREHGAFMTSLRECGVGTGASGAAEALLGHFCGEARTARPSPGLLARAAGLAEEKYMNDEWNLKR